VQEREQKKRFYMTKVGERKTNESKTDNRYKTNTIAGGGKLEPSATLWYDYQVHGQETKEHRYVK
jgi:hypothetical protein